MAKMSTMYQFFDPNSLTRKAKLNAKANAGLVEIKSKFTAEFRRFCIDVNQPPNLEQFQDLLVVLHHLKKTQFLLTYTDKEGDLLPINNQENFIHAIKVSKPLLRVCVQLENNFFQSQGYGGALPKKNLISRILEPEAPKMRKSKDIGMPAHFRHVSAIIDADILPTTQRRVKLIRDNTEKPLGFFVRDGFSIHPTASGSLERVAGVFISRLVPGGLAEGTGLLAANDEVLEVNGIEVAGKSLDQVTDMMVANSGHLIITIKPCNQYSQVTLPQPTGPFPPLITSSFNDLSRKNSSARRKRVDMKASNSMHDLTKAENSGEVDRHVSVEELMRNEKGMENIREKEDDEDDVMEFKRRDPSGSSASNRNSAQLMQLQQQQQQQQLLHLEQLTLQKLQLEEQLKLQTLHPQQQQFDTKPFNPSDTQQMTQQHILLQQYELQQSLKQNDDTRLSLSQQNQPFNNYDNNNINTSYTSYNYSDQNVNISAGSKDKNWFNDNNMSQFVQQNNTNIHNSPIQHSSHNHVPSHYSTSSNSQLDNNHNSGDTTNYYKSSFKELKKSSNSPKSFQKFSRNVVIKDLQSLDQIDKRCYDEENIRFVEGGDHDQVDIFANSSLRIAPSSSGRNRQSSRSVDHHMNKRKARF